MAPRKKQVKRKGIEVTLLPEDVEYARSLTGGNLSAALTILIRQHRRPNQPVIQPPLLTMPDLKLTTPASGRKR